MKRTSGVLMHLSSLFGDYSIGSLGREGRDFVDFLYDSGFGYWQVLPFTMTDMYNSPYSSPSAFALNPYFIDLPTLYEKGYITKGELDEAKGRDKYLCEFERLGKERLHLLSLAAKRMKENKSELASLEKFIESNRYFDTAARFLALREQYGSPVPKREPSCERLFFWQFVQYEFFLEWTRLKSYANGRGIKIIGDIPMYLSLDSAEVWSEPISFLLDENGAPTSVAGVPPDYFSPDGQMWNNPLYNYEKMRENGFLWWRKRIRYMIGMFDAVRIDHFRAFDSFWSIPKNSKSAREGKWIEGPRRDIIDAIRKETGDRLIIAEDLGEVGESVEELLAYSKFLGMRVFEFAFLGDKESPHLPHNYKNECVAYTSTHDNNTLLGYLFECDAATRAKIFEYCGYFGSSIEKGQKYVIRSLLASSAGLVIFPIQDILGFGRDTRMNTPGTALGNWGYRLSREQLFGIDRKELRRLNELYGRL